MTTPAPSERGLRREDVGTERDTYKPSVQRAEADMLLLAETLADMLESIGMPQTSGAYADALNEKLGSLVLDYKRLRFARRSPQAREEGRALAQAERAVVEAAKDVAENAWDSSGICLNPVCLASQSGRVPHVHDCELGKLAIALRELEKGATRG